MRENTLIFLFHYSWLTLTRTTASSPSAHTSTTPYQTSSSTTASGRTSQGTKEALPTYLFQKKIKIKFKLFSWESLTKQCFAAEYSYKSIYYYVSGSNFRRGEDGIGRLSIPQIFFYRKSNFDNNDCSECSQFHFFCLFAFFSPSFFSRRIEAE